MENTATAFASVWEIPVTTIQGKKLEKLGDVFGEGVEKPKLTIIMNVASEIIQKEHGLEVLAFPCNQFGAQEPGSNEQIFDFVCTKYQSHFKMFDKLDVNGDNVHPVYQFLKGQENLKEIEWNFGKFLVNREGQVLEYVEAETEPNQMFDKILKYLGLQKDRTRPRI